MDFQISSEVWLEEMFPGWEEVRTFVLERNAGRKFVVQLEMSDLGMMAMRKELGELAANRDAAARAIARQQNVLPFRPARSRIRFRLGRHRH